ncbi:MAG: hypothetical protein LC775_10830 [Acidobacteria bacterium]|nr:hypothetical protein [Acidobacteriota bacterium]
MRVTDSVVASVLDPSAGLELRVPVTWKAVDTTVRARLALHNVHALPLSLNAQVLIYKPWKFSVFLMLHGSHLRRLDVNGSHRNRTSDREQWIERTHKHRWSEAHDDAEAYTPRDIPPVPLTEVAGEHYRRVFEAFCSECGIHLAAGYCWSDPLAAPRDGSVGQGG